MWFWVLLRRTVARQSYTQVARDLANLSLISAGTQVVSGMSVAFNLNVSVNTVIVLGQWIALEKKGIDLDLLVPTNNYINLLEGILGQELLASSMILFLNISKFCYGQ